MLNKKGQGALEYLLIIGGVIIIAIIVIFIIVSTGSSNRDNIDSSQNKMNNVTDSAIFPPRIKSSTCSYLADGNIYFKLNIYESPTPNITQYCYIMDNNSSVTDCNLVNNGVVEYRYIRKPQDDNSFAITLISKSDANLVSNPSVVNNCYIR